MEENNLERKIVINLFKKLKAEKIRPARVAEFLEVEPSTVSRYKSGEIKMPTENVIQVCEDLLNISYSELVVDTSDLKNKIVNH